MNIFDPHISGSLSVSGSGVISGDLTVLGTINATISGTTSNAISASEAPRYTLTSSFETFTSSIVSKTGSYATTGSNLFKGTQTHSGSIIPSVDNTYDLGSPDYQWRDVYISSGSLYIDGSKVLSSTAQELTITTDEGQSIKILEGTTDSIVLQVADGDIELKSSADGDILLDPTNGKIMLKGPVEIFNGNKIQSSVNGTPVVFANDIVVSGSIELTGTIDGIDLSSLSSSLNTRIGSIESTTLLLNEFTSSANGRLNNLESETSSLSSSIGSISSSITNTTNNLSGSIGVFSSSFTSTITNLSSSMIILSSSFTDTDISHTNRLNTIESRYTTTGSNVFIGNQTITGSLYVSQNLIVQGESSLENVTASAVSIGTNTVILNSNTPSVRYAGIAVYDSGSTNVTASLLYDSLTNQWKFKHLDTGTNDASVLLYGPLGNDIDNTPTLTSNFLTKVEDNDHGHHLTTSSVFDNGSKISLKNNTEVTGSLIVTGTLVSQGTTLISGSSQVSFNTISDKPSGIISGSSQVVSSLPNGTVSGSSQVSFNTISDKPTLVSGSSQISFNSISDKPTLVSGSSQISYPSLSNIPGGIVSGSSQIDLTATTNYSSGIKTRLNAEGVVSGSSQVLNSSGIWSGSAQLPSGVVSGSSQVTLSSTTGYGSVLNQAVLTTSAPTFAELKVNGVIESPYLGYKPIVFYDFNSDTTGDWGKLNSTLSTPSKSITRYTSTGTDSNINRGFNFSGGQNQIIRIHYKVVSGTPGGGQIFYSNSQHGYSGSYYKALSLINDGNWHTLVLDMSNLSSGGTDWIDYNVTAIRFDLTDNSGVEIDIDWISIGGNGYGTQYFENDVAFMEGSVGFGTTSPTTGKVVIKQTGGTQLNLVSGDSSGSTDVLLKLTSGIDYRGRGIWMENSDTAGAWYAGVPYTGGAYSIGYSTTAPEYVANSKFFINTSGNVGIGTTVPAAKLSVTDMLLNIGASSSNANMGYTTFANGVYSALNSTTPSEGVGMWSDNQGNGMIGSLYNNNASSLNLVVRASSSTSGFIALKILGNGNVGINTSTLSSKFTVYKGSQSNTVSIANSAAYIYGADIGLAIGQDSGAAGYGTWLQSMQTGGNSFPMTINPNGGNVIVGSLTTSSYKFSVFGGQYGTYLRGGDLGTGSDILRLVDSAGSTKYLARGDGKHYFEGDVVINGGDFKFNPGTGDLANRYFHINKGASNDGGILMSRDNVLDWQIINATGTGDLSFYSYGTGSNPLVLSRSTGVVTTNNGINIGNSKLRWGGTSTPTLGLPFSAAGALWLEVNDGDTGGIAIDNDGVTVFGAGDNGYVFRVIDEDVYQSISNVTNSTTFQVNQGQNGGGYMRGPFDVTGNLTVGGTLTENSSLRYKKDIVTIEGGLDKVMRMRGVTYLKKETNIKEVGVIAEEINEILPDLVKYNTEGQIDSVSYSRITAVLIEAIKELKQEINDLKNNG